MIGRPIVNKHKAYTFHRPSALWIAQIIVDTGFAASQILLFSIMVYFMCGLVLDAGAFFTFYIVIVTGYLAMTLFFRTSKFPMPSTFPVMSWINPRSPHSVKVTDFVLVLYLVYQTV